MLKTVWGVVKKDKVELLEKGKVPEGTRAFVTLLINNEDTEFWLRASENSLNKIWNNDEDDIYAGLLK